MKQYDLGTEKIGRLVRHFAVPCVISMLVAALYNIVDQIFIGWSSAGAYGNAATNIVYPFTVFALGVALLVGDGSAANFSIELGKQNGLVLCDRLLAIDPLINIIFVTGYPDYALDAWETKACGFLVKPLRKEEVEKVLTKLRYPVRGALT